MVQLVTTGLRIPIGNVRHVYCIRAVDEQVALPDDGAEVQSVKSVVLHELGNAALLRTVQRRYPGWLALSYKDVVHVAAASKFLRRAIMGQSATTDGSLNPFTHLLPQAMLQSISPGVSPKLVVESMGGWDSSGHYSYAPKNRQEVFTVMATVAPDVVVSFTDTGTLSICARSQGEPISRVTAKVVKQAQRLLQQRYGHGNLPGSVGVDAVCYRCCCDSKYGMQRCSADGCTLHVHTLCADHVPPRCWCPHNAAETHMGKSRPPAPWWCARHDPHGEFDKRVASFHRRSLSGNPAYAFPRKMRCETHDCPACLMQEVAQIGSG